LHWLNPTQPPDWLWACVRSANHLNREKGRFNCGFVPLTPLLTAYLTEVAL